VSQLAAVHIRSILNQRGEERVLDDPLQARR
jgi:hypothetical protein